MIKVEDRTECIKVSGEKVIASFEVCKLAKERGIDVESNHHYENSLTERDHEEDGKSGPFGWEKDELNLQNGFHWNNSEHDFSNDDWYICSAYLQSVLVRILRTKYDIHITSTTNSSNTVYVHRVWDNSSAWNFTRSGSIHEGETYEDGLEQALLSALKYRGHTNQKDMWEEEQLKDKKEK